MWPVMICRSHSAWRQVTHSWKGTTFKIYLPRAARHRKFRFQPMLIAQNPEDQPAGDVPLNDVLPPELLRGNCRRGLA
jgi:hypothetical protein